MLLAFRGKWPLLRSLTLSAEGLDEAAFSLLKINKEGLSESAAAQQPDYSRSRHPHVFHVFPTCLPQFLHFRFTRVDESDKML